MPNGPVLRVFVVDDEPYIATSLALILRSTGFSAVPFTNPLAVIATAYSNQPDILVSDVVMPTLSGVELALQIKKLWPECIVLLLSADIDRIDLAPARTRGLNFPVFEKPIQPNLLIAEIKKLVALANVQNVA
jgi:CheY-like chemotaxis protein